MSPEFRLVFFSVLGLTIACGTAAVAINLFFDPQTPNQEELSETLLWLFTLGAGAIIGALGSNATHTDAPSKRPPQPEAALIKNS